MQLLIMRVLAQKMHGIHSWSSSAKGVSNHIYLLRSALTISQVEGGGYTPTSLVEAMPLCSHKCTMHGAGEVGSKRKVAM